MTTNEAFIKAYRQDAAEPTPLRPTTSAAASPRAMAAVPGTSVEFVSLGATTFAATYETTGTALPREPQVDTNPIWPTCDAPFGRIDTPSRGKRPLSAFTAARVHARPSRGAAAADAMAVQPTTTVASFAWPPVCRSLCQLHGQQYAEVAQRLLRRAESATPIIGLIGLFPGCGTTTTLLCLAARLASAERRTIVVEGNFIAPRLAAWLDAEPTAWWQDVLERGARVADAVVRAEDDHLDLLPLAARTAHPMRLASAPQVADTSAALRHSYDLALVDLGPFFDPESQPIALELVKSLDIDAVLVVAGPAPADPRDLATLAEYLRPSGCELLGTIENRIARSPAAAHKALSSPPLAL